MRCDLKQPRGLDFHDLSKYHVSQAAYTILVELLTLSTTWTSAQVRSRALFSGVVFAGKDSKTGGYKPFGLF